MAKHSLFLVWDRFPLKFTIFTEKKSFTNANCQTCFWLNLRKKEKTFFVYFGEVFKKKEGTLKMMSKLECYLASKINLNLIFKVLFWYDPPNLGVITKIQSVWKSYHWLFYTKANTETHRFWFHPFSILFMSVLMTRYNQLKLEKGKIMIKGTWK